MTLNNEVLTQRLQEVREKEYREYVTKFEKGRADIKDKIIRLQECLIYLSPRLDPVKPDPDKDEKDRQLRSQEYNDIMTKVAGLWLAVVTSEEEKEDILKSLEHDKNMFASRTNADIERDAVRENIGMHLSIMRELILKICNVAEKDMGVHLFDLKYDEYYT